MNKIEILYKILKDLKDHNLNICVLSIDTNGDIQSDTDIDLITSAKSTKKTVRLILKTIEDTDWKSVNFFWHGGGGIQLYLTNEEEHIILDIYDKFWLNDKLKITFNKNFEIIKHKNFYIPAPECEFTYLLLKRFSKNSIEERHYNRLFQLIKKIKSTEHPFFKNIYNTIGKNNLIKIIDELKQEKKLSIEKINEYYFLIKRNRFEKIITFIKDIHRFIFRVTNPTGAFISFLGTDGSGKSSIINKLLPDIDWIFRKNKIIHFRPAVLDKKSENIIVSNPHANQPRSKIISILKLIYYYLDFLIGYIKIVKPNLIGSSLLIFDRYFYDIIVDPLRYRYGASNLLVEALSKIVPKPNIVFILNSSEDILYKRKQELSIDELKRQIHAYNSLSKKISKSILIDASQDLKVVVENVKFYLLSYMNNRTEANISKYLK